MLLSSARVRRSRSINFVVAILAVTTFSPRALRAQVTGKSGEPECPKCAEWNVPQEPFRIFGNTYFVGTHGLSAILITSNNGDVLIDGALPESAPLIAANIAKLGFRMNDVKLIVNSHDHFDHAGGIAELQKMSGAKVDASPLSAPVLRRGASSRDDPQFGLLRSYPPIKNVSVVTDGETVHVGDIALTAHFTPGHTPGGTTWTWKSCEGDTCYDMVYADSQTPGSADNFLFTRNTTYPNAIKDFERGFKVLESLSCDVLMTPHADWSGFWQRMSDSGKANGIVDRDGCKRYAEAARQRLAKRIASEAGKE